MLKRHSIGLALLIIILGICYAMADKFSQLSVSSLTILSIALIGGYVLGAIAPALASSMFTAMPEKKSIENKTLYVGNLPFRTTRYELRELFQPYGKIHSARIVIDRVTKKPRGYGFVEMDGKGADKAMNSLNGHTLAGRNLKVSEANERE